MSCGQTEMNTDETMTGTALATEPHGQHGMEEEDLTFKIRGRAPAPV